MSKQKSSSRVVEAGLITAGLTWTESGLVQKENEYSVSVKIESHVWISVTDTDVGLLVNSAVGSQRTYGWYWGEGFPSGVELSDSQMVTRILVEVKKKFQWAHGVNLFVGREKQDYLIAKLVRVSDPVRFVELSRHLDMSQRFIRETVAGIVALHGDEIARVMKNVGAGLELVR